MRSKAFRRYESKKALARAKAKWPFLDGVGLHIAANHRTLCSCAMCGNPRRFGGGPKISELRKEIRDKDRIKEEFFGGLTQG